ncbi:hypothetical protein UACE39S_02908 [Ureibacillus acetophenoni]
MQTRAQLYETIKLHSYENLDNKIAKTILPVIPRRGVKTMNQTSIPCKIYRGGTSRGIFFKEKDLALYTKEQIDEIVKFSIDAQNSSQVDGLGGASSHTSK